MKLTFGHNKISQRVIQTAKPKKYLNKFYGSQ